MASGAVLLHVADDIGDQTCFQTESWQSALLCVMSTWVYIIPKL